VLSTSSDGTRWSNPAQVPIDDRTSGVDHFIPGLAVDRASSGASARLALTYYFYPDATCTGGCQLTVGYISSPDGGAHWGAPEQLAGPMALSDIAQTSQGPMVGDYISTSVCRRRCGQCVHGRQSAHHGSVRRGDVRARGSARRRHRAQATRAASEAGATTGQARARRTTRCATTSVVSRKFVSSCHEF